MHTFPDGFLWGAATAPHQVEGNNVNSDFWAQEERMPGADRSGDALDGVEWVCTLNEPNMLAIMAREAEATLDPDSGPEWLSPTLEADTPRPVKPAPPVETGRRLVEAHHAARDVLRQRTDARVGWPVASRAFVRGYVHWSLLNNYEWGHWDPTFGLVAVDRETFERRLKPSLAWLGGVARANALRDGGSSAA
ncbi:family 1 glycosylhydrolase [Nonomuraea angiospora]|uniref:family 1 glycosylhydrolase n=1 Tax=Nonomuraea angiospora TaxID=46172 RepID=UPI00343D094D